MTISAIPDRFRRIVAPVYERRRIILLHAGPEAGRAIGHDLPVTRLAEIAAGSAAQMAMIRSAHWDVTAIAHRRSRGDVCYTVDRQGRCVHFSWLSTAKLEATEVEYSAVLPPRHGWIYSCFTESAHRGQGIFTRVLKHIIYNFYQEGGEALWIGVLDTNEPSLRGIKKAGFSEVAAIEQTSWFSGQKQTKKTTMDATLAQKLPLPPE